jgi:tetratricopeptide (TPR) repeat protein
MNPFRAAKLPSWGGPNLKELLRREWLNRDEGERQLEHGSFGEAEKYLALAVEESQQKAMPQAVQARVLRLLATAQFRLKNLPEASKNVESAIALLGDAGSKDAPELAHCLDVKGCVKLADNDLQPARDLIRESIEIEEKFKKPSQAILAERYRHLAQVLRNQGEHAEALTHLDKALGMAIENLGPENVLVADILADRASVYHLQGRLEEGFQCLERALAIHKQTRGADSEEVTADYERLAALCQETGDLEGALKNYQKALYIRERTVGGNSPELAVLLMKIAEVYVGLGRIGLALEQMQQAVMKLELARDERLPAALETLGGLYVRTGRAEDAVSTLTRARAAWEQTPGDHTAELQANHKTISQLVKHLTPAQMESLSKRNQQFTYRNAATGRRRPDPGELSEGPSVLLDAEPTGSADVVLGFGPPLNLEEPVPVFGSQAVMAAGARSGGQSSGAPVNLTIMVPEGTPSVPMTTSLSALADHVAHELHGWEDLAFDHI